MSKYLNPKVDLTFKKVFGQHDNLVRSLLNAFLPLPEGTYISEVSYLTPEQIPDNPAKKYSIVDVKCKDNKGRIFIVEMQTYWNNAFFVRTLYNTAKAFSSQLEKAQSFRDLKSVYALSIVDDLAFPDYSHLDEYVQEYYLINRNHTGEVRDDIALIFVELPKYKPVDRGQRALRDLWMKYFTEIDEETLEADPDLLDHPDTSEALEIVKRSAYTDAELAAYEKSRLDEITERSAINESREEGRAEGREEGEAIGMEKGRAEGRAEGAHDMAVSIAKSMLASGISPDQVAQFAKLPIEEVEAIE